MADAEAFRGAEQNIARLAQEKRVRFGVVGGAGSLLVAEGGPKFMDTPEFPKEFAAEPRVLDAVLDDLRASDEDLDWFFVSPAGGFGDYSPGRRRAPTGWEGTCC